MRARRHDPQVGMVLLVVMGVLAVLSMLGLSLAVTARMEQETAGNYVDQLRARLVAESGLQFATARLREKALGKTYLLADPKTLVVQAWDRPDETWVFRHDQPNLTGDLPQDVGHGIPIAQAQNPSFREPTLPFPASHAMLESTYQAQGDYFSLKILDTSSQLNLNMKHPKLVEILVVLGQEIASDQTAENPIPSPEVAQKLLAYRDSLPGQRFISKRQLRMTGVLSEAQSSALKDYVSVHGWFDEDVIEPRSNASFRDPVSVERSPRVPVNINTAPFPVLVALIAGLSGQAQRFVENGPSVFGANGMEIQTEDVPPISREGARAVAREIVRERNARRGFMTWSDVEAFVDGLANSANAGQTFGPDRIQEKAAILLANANPNTRLNRFSPVAPLYRVADKVDLSYWTTEFSFSNGGFFEIESLGRVLDSEDRLVAEAVVSATLKVSELLRHSTQEEFLRSALVSPDPARIAIGPEPYWLNPQGVHADGYIQLSTEWTQSRNGAGSVPASFFAAYRGTFQAEGPAGAATTTKDTGSLLGGGDLSPDGILSWRETPEQLSYSSNGTGLPQTALDPTENLRQALQAFLAIGSQDFGFYSAGFIGVNAISAGITAGTARTIDSELAIGQEVDVGQLNILRSYLESMIDASPIIGRGNAEAQEAMRNLLSAIEAFMAAAESTSAPTVNAENVPAIQGAMEFWIKLPNAPSHGSDELLIHATRVLQNDGTRAEGIAWRLERFGTQLMSSRLYWGHPNGVEAPAEFPFAYTDWTFDISNWAANEWHHVAAAWYDGTSQALWVDGRAGNRGVQIAPRAPTQITRFNLRSALPEDRLFLGGFEFTPALGGTLYKIERPIQASVSTARFAHAALDDVRIYPTGDAFGDPRTANPFPVPDRYRILAGTLAPAYEGAFAYANPTGDPDLRIGTVSWTIAYPASRLDLSSGGAGRQTVRPSALPVKLFGRVLGDSFGEALDEGIERQGGPSVGAGVSFSEKKEPAQLSRVIADDEQRIFFYRLSFERSKGVGSLNVTPTIDDITISVVLSHPQIVEKSFTRVP